MRFYQRSALFAVFTLLSACSLTPEQLAEREAKRVRTEQHLQVELAKQCDVQTAQLMEEQFNPPLDRTEKEEQAFKKRYAEKVGDPMFQACYKLALENYKAQVELEEMRYDYFHRRSLGFPWRPCYTCW